MIRARACRHEPPFHRSRGTRATAAAGAGAGPGRGQSESGPLYRELDLARLQTLCDLALELEEEEDRLDVMMRLIDRLHALTAEMDAVMRALAAEPEDVRARIRTVIEHR